jgi:predicted enzyme related to lactoylglutathione lyase
LNTGCGILLYLRQKPKYHYMANAINWFEIPVSDFERACKFYGDVLGSPLHRETMGGAQMGFFTHVQGGVGGAICAGEDYTPATNGTLVYLNIEDGIKEALARVEKAGGKVLLPRTQITPDIGYMALFLDCEGNKIAFHGKN